MGSLIMFGKPTDIDSLMNSMSISQAEKKEFLETINNSGKFKYVNNKLWY